MLVDSLTLKKAIKENIEKKKAKEEKAKPKKRYYSDILVNNSLDSNWRKEVEVLDYTSKPERLLEDMKSFEENPIIKVHGLVAGLDIELTGDYNNRELYYKGIIILGSNFPLYFDQTRKEEEVSNLLLEKIMLESAKSFPIFMTGRFCKGFADGYGKEVQYQMYPFVLEMGDYISPQPNTKKTKSQ